MARKIISQQARDVHRPRRAGSARRTALLWGVAGGAAPRRVWGSKNQNFRKFSKVPQTSGNARKWPETCVGALLRLRYAPGGPFPPRNAVPGRSRGRCRGGRWSSVSPPRGVRAGPAAVFLFLQKIDGARISFREVYLKKSAPCGIDRQDNSASSFTWRAK